MTKPYPSTLDVRLTSARAPYRRAGIEFASTREPVVVNGDKLTADQDERLRADPIITIELVDIETGKVTTLEAFEKKVADEAGKAQAKAEAKAAADAAKTLKPADDKKPGA